MAFTDRTFAPDWTDHVWLIWEQKLNILDFGTPSYFLHTTTLGAYYPFYAFYGGTLYLIGGLLAVVTGAVGAIVLLYLVAFAAAYAGWTWLSFQAGLRGWVAYLPGLVAVTCPYAITVAYGRGDLAETVATSMIPLVAASALSIFRSDRLRTGTVAAFIFSAMVVTGAHTLTLIWGTTFLLGAAAIAALGSRDLVRRQGRRLVQLAGLSLLAAAVNAWTLVPLGLYSQRTEIGDHPKDLNLTGLTQLPRVLNPFRSSPLVLGADLQVQLPVLALVCMLVIGAVAWRSLPRERRVLAAGLGGLLALVLALLFAPSLMDHLPRFWRFIQFPYRLLTYADLLVVGLLIVALAGLRARPRAFGAAAAAVAVVAALSTAQGLAQALAVPSWLTILDHSTPHGREAAFISPTRPPVAWYAVGDFADASGPVVKPSLPGTLGAPIEGSRRLDYEVSYPPGPAGTVDTNVTGGPKLVQVEGAEVAGRTTDYSMVLRLPASDSPRVVKFSPRESAPILAGQAISTAALIAALGLLGALAVRDRRARRHSAGTATAAAG